MTKKPKSTEPVEQPSFAHAVEAALAVRWPDEDPQDVYNAFAEFLVQQFFFVVEEQQSREQDMANIAKILTGSNK